MNKLHYAILSFAILLTLSGCFDDSVDPPTLQELTYGTVDEAGNFSPLTQVPVGEEIVFRATSSAELLVIWPGERETIKAADGSDSLDFDTGEPLFAYNNDWDDYGLFGAKGVPFDEVEEVEPYDFVARYTFRQTGTHEVRVVATNHGYNGPDYENAFFDYTIEVVE